MAGPSVRQLVRNVSIIIDEKWTFLRILSDLDLAGRGKKRDKKEGGMRRKEVREGRRDVEEGGMGRKEGHGGRSDEESERTKKLLKNEK